MVMNPFITILTNCFTLHIHSFKKKIFIFIDVLKKRQSTTHIKVHTENTESTPRRVDGDKISGRFHKKL